MKIWVNTQEHEALANYCISSFFGLSIGYCWILVALLWYIYLISKWINDVIAQYLKISDWLHHVKAM